MNLQGFCFKSYGRFFVKYGNRLILNLSISLIYSSKPNTFNLTIPISFKNVSFNLLYLIVFSLIAFFGNSLFNNFIHFLLNLFKQNSVIYLFTRCIKCILILFRKFFFISTAI